MGFPGDTDRVRPPTVIVSGTTERRQRLASLLSASASGPVLPVAAVADLAGRVPASGSIVVMDVSAPPRVSSERGGVLDHLRALVRRGWRRLVVLDDPAAPVGVRTAIALGIRGYVVARVNGRESRSGAMPATVATFPQGLSTREVEVLQLVSRGMSNRDVGAALGLSALTVKSHLARIGRKLGNGDRAAMVAAAFRAGLVL